VVFGVVSPAEPAHLERLGVVVVVRVGFTAAHLAPFPYEPSAEKRCLHDDVGASLLRILRLPRLRTRNGTLGMP